MDAKTVHTPDSKLYIGSAYYPEQWPEETWKKDMRLMGEAGFNVVRLGDFAWSALEPEEGRFELEWLKHAIKLFGEAGIQTVLCTPTASPPAWLVKKYPEVLPVDENGRQVQFGNRCHYCVNSADFHQQVRSLVAWLAEVFNQNEQVIGWQIDNEYNRYCYCQNCRSQFQKYLAGRYGTLDELNRLWTTRYWSQTYDAWDEIPLPVGPHNPGLMLEFKHFMTLSYKRFQIIQVDEIRRSLRPGAWITHNFMDWHDGYDHYTMSEDLDIAAWDWYVGMGNHDYQRSGAAHDLVRGYKRKNFWLMETQPGTVNWKPINSALDKGEIRAMAWHAVGHGADAVLYWQWRSPLNGQEQYHGTLVDTAGEPRLIFGDASQVARDFTEVSQLIAGSRIEADAAIVNCYDSRWSISQQRHHRDFDYVAHLQHYYRPLCGENIPVDIISADKELGKYKLVIAPALLILDNQRVEHLKEFVEGGGCLVITIRSGMKDEFNALLPSRQPGPLTEMSGVQVDEYFALLDPVPVIGEGWQGSSSIWAERLRVGDAENTRVLASFGESNGWLDGQPAITRHAYGKGCVYFVGAYLDEASQEMLVKQVAQDAGVEQVMQTPPGVEACRRIAQDGREVYIVINHEREAKRFELPWEGYDHLSGREGSDVDLGRYEVAVVTRSE